MREEGTSRQPMELNLNFFPRKAEGKCESCRESEGGRRELGAWHGTQWVSRKKRRERMPG